MSERAHSSLGRCELAAVSIQDDDGVRIAVITGEIDISNVDGVASILSQLPNLASGLVVDLRGVTYLDSSGISLLHDLAVRLAERSQRLIIVCGPQSLPRRLLSLTALDARTPVVEELEAAVQLVREFAEQARPATAAEQ